MAELSNDPIIRNHLAALYDTLLEQNLLRIVEPYSRVQIEHIAATVRQPVREVEQKLSQMILDKVFNGILDQGAGCLVVFDDPVPDVSAVLWSAKRAYADAVRLLGLHRRHTKLRLRRSSTSAPSLTRWLSRLSNCRRAQAQERR